MTAIAPISRCAIIALALAACSRTPSSDTDAPAGVATLRDASGRTVGSASIFPASGGGVRIRVSANGLTPGMHGIHIHAVGTCDGSTQTAFSSAGGHFNPTGKEHGRQNPNGWHAGDLPNLSVDASGNGSLDEVVESLTIDSGPGSLFDTDGSAIVIHANPDDERTDSGPQGPGNSGARVACGVISRA